MGQCLYGKHGSLSLDAQHNKNLGVAVLEMQTGASLDFAGQPARLVHSRCSQKLCLKKVQKKKN